MSKKICLSQKQLYFPSPFDDFDQGRISRGIYVY